MTRGAMRVRAFVGRTSWALAALPIAMGCDGVGQIAQRPGLSTLPACEPEPEVSFERAPSGHAEVDVSWLAAHHCAVRILDVREPPELTSELGHIEGAESAPLGSLDAHAAGVPTEQPIVVVDRSGRRTGPAQAQLAALGFQRVASLTGGMHAWRAAGLPVSRAPVVSTEAVTPPRRLATDPVRARLQDPAAIQWTSVASILGGGTEQCIDGRSGSPHVGTPGGDAGELVLALAAIEQVSERQLTDDDVAPALAGYVASFGRFYMHSDAQALERLRTSLESDPRFAQARAEGALAPERIESFVRRPPAALEDALLEQLVRPEHVGCGHLRTMLDHPQEYGARRELVQGVIREAHRLGWSHPESLDFVVLEGDHEESAVVRVLLDRPIHAYTRVPTFPGLPGETTSFFLAHPEVSAYLRRELGSFLLEGDALTAYATAPADLERLERALADLAERQLSATLRHLARELPVYDVHVRDDGSAPVVSGPNASLGCRAY